MSKRNKHRWSKTVTAPQLDANRANAQLSTGPVTSAGKAISSLNAVKTGLTGRTVLLPTDDIAAYEQHMRAYEAEYSPVGQLETDLVCSIAETPWRLARIPSLENNIFAIGALELVDEYKDHDSTTRSALIATATFLKYERQIRNLNLQEARLWRRREKEVAELRKLQEERRATQQLQSQPAANSSEAAASAQVAENGFEFANTLSDARISPDFTLNQLSSTLDDAFADAA